jgi:hypothetical protein
MIKGGLTCFGDPDCTDRSHLAVPFVQARGRQLRRRSLLGFPDHPFRTVKLDLEPADAVASLLFPAPWDTMAEFYKKAFDFKEVRKTDGPLAYGYHLSDGTIDLAILRFKTDQIGKGLEYTGLHHFGVLVDDVEKVSQKVEALGGRHYMVCSSTLPSIRGPGPSRFRPREPKPPIRPMRLTRSVNRAASYRCLRGPGYGNAKRIRALWSDRTSTS